MFRSQWLSNFLMIAETPYDLVKNDENSNRKVEYKDSDKVNRYGDYRFVNYTHCDIHPWLMMGVVASSIPFSNHNYANRNTNVLDIVNIYRTDLGANVVCS